MYIKRRESKVVIPINILHASLKLFISGVTDRQTDRQVRVGINYIEPASSEHKILTMHLVCHISLRMTQTSQPPCPDTCLDIHQL